MEVFHLEILGFPETETSEELLQAQPEAAQILCGAGRDKWIFGQCYWHWTGDDLAS